MNKPDILDHIHQVGLENASPDERRSWEVWMRAVDVLLAALAPHGVAAPAVRPPDGVVVDAGTVINYPRVGVVDAGPGPNVGQTNGSTEVVEDGPISASEEDRKLLTTSHSQEEVQRPPVDPVKSADTPKPVYRCSRCDDEISPKAARVTGLCGTCAETHGGWDMSR